MGKMEPAALLKNSNSDNKSSGETNVNLTQLESRFTFSDIEEMDETPLQQMTNESNPSIPQETTEQRVLTTECDEEEFNEFSFA